MLELIMELVFPRHLKCSLCGEEIDEEFFCSTCKASIQFNIGKVCRFCGRMIYGEIDICNNCKSINRYYDGGVSVALYDDYIKGMMYQFKYNNKTYLGHTMAKYLIDKIATLDLNVEFDGIIPVPLHYKREIKRGYNQTRIMAEFMSEISGLKVFNVLERAKETPPLNQLTQLERVHVLKDVFVMKEPLSGSYILVDDIFTTGATVNACSKILKENGVDYIFIATFTVGD